MYSARCKPFSCLADPDSVAPNDEISSPECTRLLQLLALRKRCRLHPSCKVSARAVLADSVVEFYYEYDSRRPPNHARHAREDDGARSCAFTLAAAINKRLLCRDSRTRSR